MRKIETTVYNIDELTGEARNVAISELSEVYSRFVTDLDIPELIQSIGKAGDAFGHALTDYSVGIYAHSYIEVSSDYWDDMDTEDQQAFINILKESAEDGRSGSCPFTGVYYDCFFFDYFKGIGLTVDNFSYHVINAMDYMKTEGVKSIGSEIESVEVLEDFAEVNGYEFTENGNIF